MNEVLKVENLSVSFTDTRIDVLKNISFKIEPSETLGLVGESGSGKSLTALSILNQLPHNAEIIDGHITVDRDSLAVILQDPTTSLNPLKTVGNQLVEIISRKQKIKRAPAKKIVLEQFAKLQLPKPDAIFNKYPNELSGGQQQRVMIALSLSVSAKLIIADEPTTALDSTVQKDILSILKKLVKEYNLSLLLISHDLDLVSELCDRVAIMKDGEIVEKNSTLEIFKNPQTVYTKNLISARKQQIGSEIKNYSDKVILEVKDLDFFYDKSSFRSQKFHALKTSTSK